MITEVKHQVVRAQGGGMVETVLSAVISEWWGKNNRYHDGQRTLTF